MSIDASQHNNARFIFVPVGRARDEIHARRPSYRWWHLNGNESPFVPMLEDIVTGSCGTVREDHRRWVLRWRDDTSLDLAEAGQIANAESSQYEVYAEGHQNCQYRLQHHDQSWQYSTLYIVAAPRNGSRFSFLKVSIFKYACNKKLSGLVRHVNRQVDQWLTGKLWGERCP
jgi:hypothetical protein